MDLATSSQSYWPSDIMSTLSPYPASSSAYARPIPCPLPVTTEARRNESHKSIRSHHAWADPAFHWAVMPNHFTKSILQPYSQIRRLLSYRPFPKNRWQDPPEAIPTSGSHWQPMDTFLFHRNCTSRTHGMAGNREASGFVNSAVMALFIKPPASRLLAVPWFCLVLFHHSTIPSLKPSMGPAAGTGLWGRSNRRQNGGRRLCE